MKKQEKKLEAGDVVTLKSTDSTGVPMTIEKVSKTHASLIWFNDGSTLERDTVALSALRFVR